MSPGTAFRRAASLAATALLLGASSLALAAATIVIVNGDGPGEGFNDPTPVAPVGGNPGTTLGAQRLNAFQFAANRWGATLTSTSPIFVFAVFDPLPCTPTSAVLGAAGTWSVFANFPGAPAANTWYHSALADKVAGGDLDPGEPDIIAQFNVNLGQAGCFTGSFFYLGLDNSAPAGQPDLVAVLLHEFGHGLGFAAVTSGNTGVRIGPPFYPAVWEGNVLDTTTGLTWLQMDDTQRASSARKPRKLVWTGANTTSTAPSVLLAGTPRLVVGGANAAAGTYDVGAASFGPALTSAGVTGDIMPVVDQVNGTGLACNPLDALNALAVAGNIALVDRGVCGFAVKVKNAQNAGAKAVIVVENVAGGPPTGLGGTDPTVTIPSVRVTLDDGNLIKAALQFRSRTRSGVIGTLNLNTAQLAGADPLGRLLLFTPNPYQQGSSVSHWDTSAIPNLLMEPSINPDLTHSVLPPQDLTFRLLQDIGW